MISTVIKQTMKYLLADSIQELLKRKPFETISVKDIVDNCGVSRTTFYHHFTDKYELVTWLYRQDIEDFLDSHRDLTNYSDMLDRCFVFMRSKKSYLTNVMDYRGQNSLYDFFFNYVYIKTSAIINANHELAKDEHNLESLLKIYIMGTTSFSIEWIQNGMLTTPKEMTQLMLDCVPLRLRRYFGLDSN